VRYPEFNWSIRCRSSRPYADQVMASVLLDADPDDEVDEVEPARAAGTQTKVIQAGALVSNEYL